MASLFGCYASPQGSAPVHIESLLRSAGISAASAFGHPESGLACIYDHGSAASEEGRSVVVSGRPQWRDARLVEIAEARGDAAAFLQAVADKGGFVAALGSLGGRFWVAFSDDKEKSCCLAIDRIGQRHLYYAVVDGALYFSADLRSLVIHDRRLAVIDVQAIFNYVYFHSVPSPGTIYKGVSKLVGGSYLEFKNGVASVGDYWLPDFEAQDLVDVEFLEGEIPRVLEQATRHCYEGGRSVGAFLSGGLDSSSITAMLCRVANGAGNTFSIGFGEKDYDETEYARLAVKSFGAKGHEYYVTPDDVRDSLPVIATGFSEPFGNSSALPAYFCAKMARDNGINRLLAGDGGDEIFSGNARYVKQMAFEKYGALPAFLRKGLFEPLLTGSDLAKKFTLTRKARSYVEQARLPLPDRLERYNFLHQFSPFGVFSESVMDVVDPDLPLGLLRHQFNKPERASLLNRMLYSDWKRTLQDNDLVKVNCMCDLAGVEVEYPMLDDELVELSCRIPAHVMMRGNQLRWLYKHAMRNILPHEIINKQKHGFGLPFGIWVRQHAPLRDIAYDSLSDLRGRGYFLSSFIDDAIDKHRAGHASYYGELIWVLMMLEMWLSSHEA